MRYTSRTVNGKDTARMIVAHAGNVPPMTGRTIQRIESRLTALGLTARAASLQAGLGADAIRNILRGKSGSPKGSTLVRLAEVLRCSVGYLAGEDADGPPDTVAPIEDSITAEELRARRFKAARYAWQPDLERAAGVLKIDAPTLREIEAGERPASDPILMRFAEVTGTPLDWLLLGKITAAMRPEMAVGIALFDPALVRMGLPAAPTPDGAPEMASCAERK